MASNSATENLVQCTSSGQLSLCHSLSFFLPGIGVVATTLRRKARPTTLWVSEWPALGLLQSAVQNYKVCPRFPCWHPPLYSKRRTKLGPRPRAPVA